MTDLPQHAAQVALLRQLGSTGPFASWFETNWFTPYVAAYALISALATFVGIPTACKIVVSAALAGLPAGTALILGENGADRRWGLLVVPAMYGFPYYWGFLSFVVALPVGLVILWLSLRYARDPTLRDAVVLALLLNGLFFCHAMAWIFFGLIGALLVLAGAKNVRGGVTRLLPFAGTVPVFMLWLAHFPRQPHATLPVLWDLGWLSTAEPYYALLASWKDPGGWGWGRVSGFFPRLLGADFNTLTIATGLALFAIPFWAQARFSLRRVLWIPFLVCSGTLLFVPSTALGTAFVYQRFTVLALPFFLVALDFPSIASRPEWPMTAAIIVVSSSLAVAGSKASTYRRDAAGFDEILANMDPRSRVLSVIIDRDSSGIIAPVFLHYALWYGARLGGVVDPSLASMPLALVKYREGRQPVAQLTRSEWLPGMLMEASLREDDYRYCLARATVDPMEVLPKDIRCRARVLRRAGKWWLYEVAEACS
jgi:hypothetical protein